MDNKKEKWLIDRSELSEEDFFDKELFGKLNSVLEQSKNRTGALKKILKSLEVPKINDQDKKLK